MLQSIHVKNLALIEETEVYFKEGLNIITGETGAGKSLLLGSVNLALGGKFDSSMLRTGCDSGFVSLVFLDESKEVLKKLEEMELEPSGDGTIIITRKLSQGKSSVKINGETVTIKQASELASELIDVHGQHEHQSLTKISKHLEILDAFGEDVIAPLLEETKVAFNEHKEAVNILKENEKDTSVLDREKALLSFECNEIESAGLVLGEDEELEKKYRKMSNARKIVEALSECYSLTSESDADASSLIGQALRSISSVSSYDDNIENLSEQLSQIESLLNDFNREVSSYMSDYDFEEEEYHEVTLRLDLINDLKKKYGRELQDILDYAKDAREKLDNFENYDIYIRELKENEKRAEKRLLDACEKLSRARRKVAISLKEKLTASLESLNFLTVVFDIDIKNTAVSSKGFDEVCFMISTNPGEAVKPLGDVASGGELSRIMLGIKTVMAAKDNIDTLIFDEIDSGISGVTAWKVSKQLGLLGKKHQVICITHLPQIAAMADAHYVIEKNMADNVTTTNVRFICQDESVRELARLLGGEEGSQAAIDNANDMISKADEYKASVSK